MNFAALLQSPWVRALANHLWQSTVFVLIVLLLTVVLRRSQARTRFWLWMLASLKFLWPFSLLIAAGEWLHPESSAAAARPEFVTVLDGVTQPLAYSGGGLHAAATTPAFTFLANGSSMANGRVEFVPVALLTIWMTGTLVCLARWAWRWWSVYRIVRRATPSDVNCPILVRATTQHLEPGVFGIFRPVLLLPEGIHDRLNADQLDAIIDHELCHVRRRDNLTAAIHMLVEALFWFYPPVWWIGARLLEERERACDEAVLESHREPVDYAESILGVCKAYMETPLRCVSGVTGSDLKKRITRIVASPVIHRLDMSRKMLLTAVAALVIAVPVTVGVMHADGRQDQTASSNKALQGTWQGTIHVPKGPQLRTVVKVSGTEPDKLKVVMYSIDQGGRPIPATSASFKDGILKFAIQFIDGSYEGKMSSDGHSISGTWSQGPGKLPLVLERATPETAWTIPAPPPKIPPMAATANPSFEVATIKPSKPGERGKAITVRGANIVTINYSLLDMITTAYSVQQSQVLGGPKWISSDKFDLNGKPDTPGLPSVDQIKIMLRKLLADRFQLKFHRDTKKMSAYVLTVAKNGPKMEKGSSKGLPGLFFTQLGLLTVHNATMDEFAQVMQTSVFDRPVVNDTGLKGTWDFLLKWTPDQSQFSGMGIKVPPPSNAADAPPPLFTAIQEQIGLKLKAGKAQVPVLMIDHVEPPSPN